MLSLKRAGKVDNDRLAEHLAKYRYKLVPHISALLYHHTQDATFMLCVDNLGVKYTSQADTDHLLNAIRDRYTISVDWTEESYIGLTFKCDYE